MRNSKDAMQTPMLLFNKRNVKKKNRKDQSPQAMQKEPAKCYQLPAPKMKMQSCPRSQPCPRNQPKRKEKKRKPTRSANLSLLTRNKSHIRGKPPIQINTIPKNNRSPNGILLRVKSLADSPGGNVPSARDVLDADDEGGEDFRVEVQTARDGNDALDEGCLALEFELETGLEGCGLLGLGLGLCWGFGLGLAGVVDGVDFVGLVVGGCHGEGGGAEDSDERGG